MYTQIKRRFMDMSILLVSVALMIVGCFLPWTHPGNSQAGGFEDVEGIIVFLLGIIAIIIYFSLKKLPRIAKTIIIMIGLLSLITTVMAITSLYESSIRSIGIGLISMFVGSIGLIITPFLLPKNISND